MEMYPNAKSFEINSIEGELDRNIEQCEKIERYNVDGYDEESNTIYDFLGCFFH